MASVAQIKVKDTYVNMKNENRIAICKTLIHRKNADPKITTESEAIKYKILKNQFSLLTILKKYS
jgi:hypothetical protein